MESSMAGKFDVTIQRLAAGHGFGPCNSSREACADMRGWFDLFRTDGGPTLYHHSNRTAVTGDVSTIIICLVFATILTGFLIIFPGVRNQKFTTFTCVVLSIFTGIAITLGATGSQWQTGSVRINTFYRAFSSDSLLADLGVHVGLNHVNVTLKALATDRPTGDIDFNERFLWEKPLQMREEYRQALIKGLPYPILTVAEYLSGNNEGFNWGFQYRVAGYYTSIVIWTAFASWLLMNVLLLNVPRYGAYMMTVTGLLMCLSCVVYCWCKPSRPLEIRFEGAVLDMALGWQFYLVLIAGIVCVLFGVTACIVDLLFPHTFSTILEVDFGTPYDRHILIEESEEVRKRPTLKIPKLEEPISAGIEATTKLIRRLSKRGGGDSSIDPRGRSCSVGPSSGGTAGVDNVAFELETNPSGRGGSTLKLNRHNDSKKSTRSISFKHRGSSSGNHLDLPMGGQSASSGSSGVSGLDGLAKTRVDMMERQDSKSSNLSMLSGSVAAAASSMKQRLSLGGDVCDDSWKVATEPRRHSSQSVSSNVSLVMDPSARSAHNGMLMVPSGLAESVHPVLEKRDSRSSNIIVFHTQDARGHLTRRQSTDPVPLDP